MTWGPADRPRVKDRPAPKSSPAIIPDGDLSQPAPPGAAPTAQMLRPPGTRGSLLTRSFHSPSPPQEAPSLTPPPLWPSGPPARTSRHSVHSSIRPSIITGSSDCVPSIRSFTHSSTHSLVTSQAFLHSFIHSVTVYPSIHPLIRLVYPFITQPLTHPGTESIQSLIHSSSYQHLHSLVPSQCYHAPHSP